MSATPATPAAAEHRARIALVGNPNSGKTTLFNALTGARQRVGNWPGVTVERKSGTCSHGDDHFEVVDLPGTYSLDPSSDAIDEQITRDYLEGATGDDAPDLVLNVVDASTLARGLYLTTQLMQLGKPVVVALNMMDVAHRHGLHIDPLRLTEVLGCPVVPVVASRGEGLGTLLDVMDANLTAFAAPSLPDLSDSNARYAFVDRVVERAVHATPVRRTITDRIDSVVLNRVLALPLFLGVMYLMFLFTINVGSAFIDLFDLLGQAFFVDAPRQALEAVGAPGLLIALLADGVGGGVQLVGTFIPVIASLFLFLSALEDSGYMARVAFIVDRALKRLGLPGKSFVPLIVGFGCNVPAVMATRTLDNQPDRILTTLMAPYMSCGARLTVYALFAAAFFPTNGQNVVFALYLIGIVVAVLSALAAKRWLVTGERSTFVLELPAYHLPTLRGVLLQTWQRLKGFVLRAGKAIVAVVIILNVVNSVGTDGSIGNQDSEKSVLSAIGRTITPAFAPMGIDEDNWPATVGIFTGIFAKEVVVGTLDALYAPADGGDDTPIGETVSAAFASVPANLADLAGQLTDPLGLDLGDLGDTAAAAEAQEVQLDTISAMQGLFLGQLGAFAYLLFILLYMPCVATIGVIYKESGAGWATFTTLWSIVVAYGLATVTYQVGTFSADPARAATTLAITVLAVAAAFAALIRFGRRTVKPMQLIPVTQL